MTVDQTPVQQRDDAQTGLTARSAVCIGWALAGWYPSKVPRIVMKDVMTMQGFVVYDTKALSADDGLDPNAAPQCWGDLAKGWAAFIAQGRVPRIALGHTAGFGMEVRF